MQRLSLWVKNNKLTTVLLLVLAYLLWKNFTGGRPIPLSLTQSKMMAPALGSVSGRSGIALPNMGGGEMAYDSYSYVEPEAPPTSGTNRMVVRDTSLSLQVKNVGETIDRIENEAMQAGGYMVDSNLSVPEGAASGTISIRVPAEKRKDVLTALRGMAVKVVSESVLGRDVTDQYADLEARLAVLAKTKAKFEEILDKAVEVSDLLNIQRELVNLQAQIDSVKGQQQYLAQTAKLTKITVYLATDEFALPYTPDQPWRPDVIFKQAVRSLVGAFRSVGTLLIWVVVYAVIWVPLLLIVIWWMKRTKQI